MFMCSMCVPGYMYVYHMYAVFQGQGRAWGSTELEFQAAVKPM